MALRPDPTAGQPGDAAISASGRLQTWGYHNTFSTHASSLPDVDPPSYTQTSTRSSSNSEASHGFERLPDYDCNTHFEGFLDMKIELATPFLISHDQEWHRVYVVLYGTQLAIYRVKKSLFRSKPPRPGRLVRTYSLQHAEVGVACDWRKGDLIPKATFARVLPRAAQEKLYETDPELFEPVREFVFRLRVEQEQLIFCAPWHSEMLDWVEQICAGIDISPPIDDRHEPRFRSLPRRTRRQRQIEQAAQSDWSERSREEAEERFLREQEELFARLYPSLGAVLESAETTLEPVQTIERTETRPENAQEADTNDTNEFDREDVLGEAPSATTSQALPELDEIETYDPKTATPRSPMSYNAFCRFRRRCAPVLLASSPRASHVIFTNGKRYHIDGKKCILIPFEQRPPRYDTHKFTEAEVLRTIAEEPVSPTRPSFARGFTDASEWSNGSTDVEGEEIEAGDMASVHTTNRSSVELDRIDTVLSTNETMLLAGSKAKGKAILVTVGKRTSTSLSKPLPRGYDRDADAITLAAAAPVFV